MQFITCDFIYFPGEDLYVFGSIVRKLRVEDEGRVVSASSTSSIPIAMPPCVTANVTSSVPPVPILPECADNV